MSEYANFVSDFPSRCRDVLEQAENKAILTGREVTLAIAIASCGLVIPMERLKSRKRGAPHPSGDLDRYKSQADSLDTLMSEKFVGSALQKANLHSWHGGTLGIVSPLNDPDQWRALTNKKRLDGDKSVSDVMGVLRNALAHGNIFTLGSPEIRDLVFLSEVRDSKKKVVDYNFVTTSPSDFTMFLRAWFDFIDTCNIEQISQNAA